MSVKKYFIAIVLPEPFFGLVEAVKQQLMEQHGLKGALRSPAHITLHRPFEWKVEKEPVLIQKLNEFKFDRSFEIFLKDFSFFEPRVIYVNVLPNEKLNELHYQFKLFAKKELHLFNEWEDMRGFHPHITVANRDMKKPKFYELQPEFTEKKFMGGFTCKGFSLLRLEQKWEVIKQFG
jgi:2'-5' RNA ligase